VVNLLTAKRRRVSQTKRDLSIKKEARLSLRRRTLARCARDSAAKLRNDGHFGRSEGGVQLGFRLRGVRPDLAHGPMGSFCHGRRSMGGPGLVLKAPRVLVIDCN